jgi:hypothetical protein
MIHQVFIQLMFLSTTLFSNIKVMIHQVFIQLMFLSTTLFLISKSWWYGLCNSTFHTSHTSTHVAQTKSFASN